MGPGTVIDAARVATQGSALRAWGDAIGGAVARHADELARVKPPSLDEGLQLLRPVSRDSVHTSGWELRHAFAWRNDDKCIQRGALGALAIAERETGSIDAAVGELARHDAMRAGLAVQYSPNFGNARFHAAPVTRTHEGDYLVVDHLFADADDGVLTLESWMRRTGARADTTTVLSPLHMPPWSLTTSGGVPFAPTAKPHAAAAWSDFAEHLTTSWQQSADLRLPAFQKVARNR